MPTAYLHHHHLLSLKGFQLPELQTTTNFFLIIPVQPPTWLNLGKVERKQIKDKFTSNYDEALPDAHYRTIYFYSQRTARQQPGTASSNAKDDHPRICAAPGSQGQLSATRGQGGWVTHRHSLEAKHSRHQEHPRIFAGKASFPVHVWKAKGTRPVQASAARE